MIEYFRAAGRRRLLRRASRPRAASTLCSVGDGGRVKSIQHIKDVGMRVNGGFFVLRQEIFDYMQEGEELVQEPFQRLPPSGKLVAYPYDGFWACMDTFKEKQLLEDMYSRGQRPGRSGGVGTRPAPTSERPPSSG